MLFYIFVHVVVVVVQSLCIGSSAPPSPTLALQNALSVYTLLANSISSCHGWLSGFWQVGGGCWWLEVT